MSEPFIAEIKMTGFNFAQRGWALCDGQLLSISQNTALFAIIGNTYGGDGESTLALPDLRGRTPIHRGNGHSLGEKGGSEMHVLTESEMPAHSHAPFGTTGDADSGDPGGRMFAHAEEETYGETSDADLPGAALDPTGSGTPHNNMQPYLTVNFQIALQGIFPSEI